MKKEENGRQQVPLPHREMRVLMVLLAATGDETMLSKLVAERAGITRNPDCVFTVLGRLRRRQLIKTFHFRALSENGNSVLFARHELTPAGRKVTKAWRTFLKSVGPAFCRQIGWVPATGAHRSTHFGKQR
jgi:hypothetical protein